MIWKNKTFDCLKWIAQIFLPAVAVFWYGIATIWEIPFAQEIQTTIIAFDTFLGALLGVAGKEYKKHSDFSTIGDREDSR